MIAMTIVFLALLIGVSLIITCIYYISIRNRQDIDSLRRVMTAHLQPPIVEYTAPNGIMLRKAHATDACYDIVTSEEFAFSAKRSTFSTGIRIALPKGYAADVRPRSGATLKGLPCKAHTGDVTRDARLYGNVELGTIDAGYRGEIKVIFTTDIYPRSGHKTTFTVPAGTRVAQLMIYRLPPVTLVRVDSLSEETDRGATGFGDSGYSV